MEDSYIKLSDLKKVKGIGNKTLERIKETLLKEDTYISKYNPNLHLKPNDIYLGDCLELMNGIKDKSIDMILCDLPYGITQNKWDSIINLDRLWSQYNRIIKDNGAIVLFSSQPFTTILAYSNINELKYELIWKKLSGKTGHLNANIMPLREHESILVFSKTSTVYNPQMVGKEKRIVKRGHTEQTNYGKFDRNPRNEYEGYYPSSILEFQIVSSAKRLHPTQKPVALLEYLIKTYTNERELILDNCTGSGSTCVACLNTNRQFIGIEKEEEYYKIAKDRVDKTINTY